MALPRRLLVGVDGCRLGWVVVASSLSPAGTTTLSPPHVLPSFAKVLALGADVVAVDIPIGLPDVPVAGGRDCDRVARRLLGFPRCTSVFSAPCRPAVGASSFVEAKAVNGGMTIQTFNICPKIAEVDGALSLALQAQVIEVHPELSFFELNGGRSVVERKRGAEGRAIRSALLSEALWGTDEVLACRPPGSAVDDVLDALAALWTAWRYAEGRALRIPPVPPLDGRGLRMEIWR